MKSFKPERRTKPVEFNVDWNDELCPECITVMERRKVVKTSDESINYYKNYYSKYVCPKCGYSIIAKPKDKTVVLPIMKRM